MSEPVAWLTSGAIAVAAWLLGLATLRASGHPERFWLAGILYCFVSSTFADFGRTAVYPHFANLALCMMIYLTVAPRERFTWRRGETGATRWHWLVGGLLLAMATLVELAALAYLWPLLSFANRYNRNAKGAPDPRPARIALFVATILPLLAVYFYKGLPEIVVGGWPQIWRVLKYVAIFVPIAVLCFIGGIQIVHARSNSDFVRFSLATLFNLAVATVLLGGSHEQTLSLAHPALALLLSVLVTAQGGGRQKRPVVTLTFVAIAAAAIGAYHYF